MEAVQGTVELGLSGDAVTVSTNPYEIKTVKVQF
jgi:hypothetical protein